MCSSFHSTRILLYIKNLLQLHGNFLLVLILDYIIVSVQRQCMYGFAASVLCTLTTFYEGHPFDHKTALTVVSLNYG